MCWTATGERDGVAVGRAARGGLRAARSVGAAGVRTQRARDQRSPEEFLKDLEVRAGLLAEVARKPEWSRMPGRLHGGRPIRLRTRSKAKPAAGAVFIH